MGNKKTNQKVAINNQLKSRGLINPSFVRIGLQNDPFFRQSKNSLGREKVRKMRGPAVQNAMSDIRKGRAAGLKVCLKV